jgi:hypothetical protein
MNPGEITEDMMPEFYANDFTEIPATLAKNEGLRHAVLELIDNQPMPGKVTEGGDRLVRFRGIIKDLVNGQIGLPEAYRRTESELPRHMSIHSGSNRVFPDGWAERQVRTQFSRFYNQAVMEKLLAEGQTQCFVPHSAAEDENTACSRQLAGSNHDLKTLYDRLVQSYAQGNWGQEVKIPDHPHCTHVVTPAK